LSDHNPSASLLTDGRASRLIAKFERLSPFLLGLVILYSLAKNLVESESVALWGDEIITLMIARQPRPSSLWTALARGADGQPPLFYLIEHLFIGLISNPHIALRLPSILAFCCTLACVYAFVRERTSNWQALICSVVLLNTTLYSTYAVQARPYSLVVAALAIAMVCYQRASRNYWVLLLFLSLALAVSFHYYAVFALGAFSAAEAVFYLAARKWRPGVWLAIFFAGFPLIVCWPLLAGQRHVFGEHFWAHAKLSSLLATYGDFFQLPTSWGVGFTAVLALSLIVEDQKLEIPGKTNGPRESFLLHEHTLLLALLGMPFVVFVVARLMHGGFLARYVLWVIPVMVIMLGLAFRKIRWRSQLVLMTFLLAAVAAREAFSLNSLHGRVGKIASPAAPVEELVRLAGYSDLPVVMWADYFEISYYASPDLAKRLVAVTDPQSAITYIGTDTVDKLYIVLGDYSSSKVCSFASFAATHNAFLLYSASFSDAQGTTVFYDWWVPKLLKDGYSLQTVAADGNRRVYLVRSPAP
jgi:4-amino-4-deoxy-L-arabinose transferase-like glycosyltransferase